MDFKEQYQKEKNTSPYCMDENGRYISNFSYSDSYVKWLEDKLSKNIDVLPVVVGKSEQLKFLIREFQTPKGNIIIEALMDREKEKL